MGRNARRRKKLIEAKDRERFSFREALQGHVSPPAPLTPASPARAANENRVKAVQPRIITTQNAERRIEVAQPSALQKLKKGLGKVFGRKTS